MTKVLFLAAAVFIFSLRAAAFGQSTPSPLKAETSGSLDKDFQKTGKDAVQLAHEKRVEFEKKVRTDLADLKAKIDDQDKKIGSQTDKTEKKVGEDLHKKIRNLNRRERDVERKLDRVGRTSEAQLNHLKSDIDKDMDKLKKGYDELLDSMKVK